MYCLCIHNTTISRWHLPSLQHWPASIVYICKHINICAEAPKQRPKGTYRLTRFLCCVAMHIHVTKCIRTRDILSHCQCWMSEEGSVQGVPCALCPVPCTDATASNLLCTPRMIRPFHWSLENLQCRRCLLISLIGDKHKRIKPSWLIVCLQVLTRSGRPHNITDLEKAAAGVFWCWHIWFTGCTCQSC